MTDPEMPHAGSSRWPEVLAIAFSLVTMAISAHALLAGQRQHEDERSTEILDAVYEDWAQPTTADSCDVLYHVEVPSTYTRARDLARALTAKMSEAEKIEILVRERVLNDPAAPLTETPDPEGIIPGFTWGAD